MAKSSIHEHLKALAAEHGGDHMHIHAHEDGYTTHHVVEGGKVEGPHEHATERELKRHISECMGDED